MARVDEEFPFACPACGGDIRLISFITDPGPIRKILTHLGEPPEPPPMSPAQNGRDQRVAPTRSFTPLGLIASPLHRLVRGGFGFP